MYLPKDVEDWMRLRWAVAGSPGNGVENGRSKPSGLRGITGQDIPEIPA
jgi:hypothetical protein